jgi:hypothetical protein
MDSLSHAEANCDDKIGAVLAANELVERLQAELAAQLKPDSGTSPEQEYGQLIEELEAAPGIAIVRKAAEREPRSFGLPARNRPTPAAREDNPSHDERPLRAGTGPSKQLRPNPTLSDREITRHFLSPRSRSHQRSPGQSSVRDMSFSRGSVAP